MKNIEAVCNPCVICNVNPAYDNYWQYIWKGKSGFACKSCKEMFYTIGTYLNEAAAKFFEDKLNIDIIQVKDKFGGFRIYMGSVVPEQVKGINELHKQYKKLFSEFQFDWDHVNE